MGSKPDPFDLVPDATARSVLQRLHEAAEAQTAGLLFHYLPKLPTILTGGQVHFSEDDAHGYYADKYIALEPTQAGFCYVTTRALRARTVVEFGTSFGISTIWLAAAVKANGGGRVISTEIVPEKAEKARAHVAEAGLEGIVDIRVGDARETLQNLPDKVDLLLNDGFPVLALEILQLVTPCMRPGAVAITDNVGMFKGNYREYLAWVRDPQNGFCSTLLPYKSGTEYSVRV